MEHKHYHFLSIKDEDLAHLYDPNFPSSTQLLVNILVFQLAKSLVLASAAHMLKLERD